MESEKEKKELIESWYKIVLDSKDLEELEKNYSNFYSSLLSFKPYKSAWHILESECNSHYSELEKDCKSAMYEYLSIQKRHFKAWKGLFEKAKTVNGNDYLPKSDFILISEDELDSEKVHSFRTLFQKFTLVNLLLSDLQIYRPLEVFEGKFFEPDFKIEKFMYGEPEKEVQRLTFVNPVILSTESKLKTEHVRFLKGRSGKDFLVLKSLLNHVNTHNVYELYKNVWVDDCVHDLYCLFVFKDFGRRNIENEVNKIKESIRNTYFHIKEMAINEISLDVVSNTRKRKKDGIIKILKANYKEDEKDIIIKKLNLELTFKRANQEGKLIRLFVERNTNEMSQGVVFAECVQKGGGFTDDEITDSLRNISKKIQRGTNKVFSFSIPKTGTNRKIKFGFTEIIKD